MADLDYDGFGPEGADEAYFAPAGGLGRLVNLIGAAMSAVVSRQDPTFADMYGRLLDQGVSPRNARHSVARAMAAVLWSIWKTGATYCPARVGTASASLEVTLSD